MSMPRDLVLVRHGESEGNLATQAAREGDLRFYTDAFTTTPGHRWRLTPTGTIQAQTIGAWMRSEFTPSRLDQPGFDLMLVSPYVRARETAAHLALPAAAWVSNRALRERDWGDIGSMVREEFEHDSRFVENARMKRQDPLYWVAPGGESIAQVAEDRVRNVLDTLHREAGGQRVLCVTHGELIWAMRLVLERWSDEEFAARDSDPQYRISNGQAIHYTRIDPSSGRIASRLAWVRTATPRQRDDGTWTAQISPWSAFTRRTESNQDLLVSVQDVPHLYTEHTP